MLGGFGWRCLAPSGGWDGDSPTWVAGVWTQLGGDSADSLRGITWLSRAAFAGLILMLLITVEAELVPDVARSAAFRLSATNRRRRMRSDTGDFHGFRECRNSVRSIVLVEGVVVLNQHRQVLGGTLTWVYAA